MRFIFLLFLSFPAYSAITAIPVDQPVVWDAHFAGMTGGTLGNFPNALDGNFTVQGGVITDWFFNLEPLIPRQGFTLDPVSADDCPEDIVCNVASFLSPTHLLFQHLASPFRTTNLDIFLSGPLSEGVTANVELRALYSDLIFTGAGAFFAPEPSSATVLGTILGMWLTARLLGRLRGWIVCWRPSLGR